MLDTDRCRDHLSDVKSFASKIGMRPDLDKQLEFLGTYAEHGDVKTRCTLTRDFAPYSFGFAMEIKSQDGEYEPWFFGGLIFHGSHDRGGDGGAPTYSVNLSPVSGWSVHT